MKDRLYIATICSEHKKLIQEFGFGTELDQFCTAENMAGSKLELCESEIAELKALYAQREPGATSAKKPSFILHAPFNELFPAAIDPKARTLAMERFQRAAELARKHGAKKMVVHSGYVPLVYYKEWHVERSVEFWKEFMEGQPEDFRIVIENVIDDEPYMLAQIVERVDMPNVRACFDTGHAACVSSLPVSEWLDVLRPHLEHLHIHNNDGSHDWHKPIMDGIVDMEQVLGFVKTKCRGDVTVTIESLDAMSSVLWMKEKKLI